MEVYNSNPKNWASKKRSQRFSDPKEKRKAHANGQQLRKVIYEGYNVTSSSEFTFTKSIRDPATAHSVTDRIQCPTPFEHELGIQMVNEKGGCFPGYSLNKHRNWERIDDVIRSVQADERCIVSKGKGDPLEHGRSFEGDTIKLGYFDMDQMKEEMDRRIREQQRHDEALDYNLNALDHYIKDRFLDSILRKQHHQRLKNWKQNQMVKPKNLSKSAEFIAPKSITARSIKGGCRILSATTRNFGLMCFWSPKKWDDRRDFIEFDLGKDCMVEAISTRGRVLIRTKECEIDHEKSEVEYVRKYKVFIKKDDAEKSSRQKTVSTDSTRNGKRNGNQRVQSVHDDMSSWTALGSFSGNKDSETEVANKLKLPNKNSEGVVCRYIRVCPLSYAEGGFHGKKSMRIGVYGNPRWEKPKRQTCYRGDTRSYGVRMGRDPDPEEEDKQKKREGEEEEKSKGNGQLINNKGVPAAIITIKKPAVREGKHARNCWAQNHRANGVCSCSCYNCKSWKHDERRLRRVRRAKFGARSAKLQHVRDYTLDHEGLAL